MHLEIIRIIQISFETLTRGRGFNRRAPRMQLLIEDNLRAIFGPTILKYDTNVIVFHIVKSFHHEGMA